MKIERKNKTPVPKPLTIDDIAVGTVFNVNVGPDQNPMIKGKSVSIGLQDGREFSHDYWQEGDDFILVNAKLVIED